MSPSNLLVSTDVLNFCWPWGKKLSVGIIVELAKLPLAIIIKIIINFEAYFTMNFTAGPLYNKVLPPIVLDLPASNDV